MIYENTKIKSEFQSFLQSKVEELVNIGIQPKLNIIQIGDDLASSKYVSIKQKVGMKLGINVNLMKFQDNYTLSNLHDVIVESKSSHSGLIFQLPVPLNIRSLVLNTPLVCDVDLLGDESNKLWNKDFLPPTIGAMDLVLKDIILPESSFENKISSKLDLNGKTVVVVGQGVLVGTPLLRYLRDRFATIISINKDTKNPKELVKLGDIVISAAGSPHLISTDWLNPNSIVIDASTSEEDGKLVGDVDKYNIPDSVCLSPSPGGIGSITVLYLFYNLLNLNLLK